MAKERTIQDNKDELKQKLEKRATSFQRYLFNDKERL